MSQGIQSHCSCPSPEVVEIPGSPGSNGSAGVAGANAFSITQANFVVPAVSATVTVTVDDNRWMQVNQIVFESNSGYYQVNSLTGTTVAVLTYLAYSGNTSAGNTVNAGAQLSPTGSQGNVTLPLDIASGGTGAATAVAALAALGVVLTLGTFTALTGATPITVTDAAVTADSAIIITLKTVGGTVGAYPTIQTITPGVGFTVLNTAGDTSIYSYLIVN